MGHSTLNQLGAAQVVPNSNVVPFPKSVMRGRKRLAGSINAGAGEISLLRLGAVRPANVVSIIDVMAEAHPPSAAEVQGLLISEMLRTLDFATQRSIHAKMGILRDYTNDPATRALGKTLSRITADIVAGAVLPSIGGEDAGEEV